MAKNLIEHREIKDGEFPFSNNVDHYLKSAHDCKIPVLQYLANITSHDDLQRGFTEICKRTKEESKVVAGLISQLNSALKNRNLVTLDCVRFAINNDEVFGALQDLSTSGNNC